MCSRGRSFRTYTPAEEIDAGGQSDVQPDGSGEFPSAEATRYFCGNSLQDSFCFDWTTRENRCLSVYKDISHRWL